MELIVGPNGLLMMKSQKPLWDEFAIKAEIRRRGHSMESLAKHLNVKGGQVRRALRVPYNRINCLIAQFLDTPTHELWPDWFDLDGDVIPAKYRRKLSRQRADSASRESQAA